MRVNQYLETLIAHTQSSELPPTFKSQAIAGLKYFHQQSLCDKDKRDRPEAIKNNWLEFEVLLIGTSLLDKFKRDKAGWLNFRAHLGIEAPKPSEIQKKRSKFEGKDANELLKHLARKSEAQRTMSEDEKNLVRVGLYFLETEAWKGKSQRDSARIKFTWKLIQPIMKRTGMLDEFLGEDDAVRRIKSFVSNVL